jgi:translocation and assembly module TamB
LTEELPDPLKVPETPLAEEPPAPKRRSRWLRRLGLGAGWSLGSILLLVVVALLGAYYFASSRGFEDEVRKRMIAALENATGGRVEIRSFQWDLLHLRAEADDITIHGLEGPDEAPYAHITRLRIQIAVFGLLRSTFSPTITLREAEVLEPQFHLIVYPDGTTNQPHPKRRSKSTKPALDSLFQAKIGQLAVEHGSAHIADSVVPLDLLAQDTQIQLSWQPDAMKWGSYRIYASLGELAFAQGKANPLPSRLDASLVLMHDGLRLDSLTLSALDRRLKISGGLKNFAHPEWQAKATGQVDLKILAPYAGFFFTRSGVVDLSATGSGNGSEFEANGVLASNAIHYQDTVVDAHTGSFAAKFRADKRQLLVSEVRVKLAQGGEIAGEFQYDNWLDSTPKPREQAALLRAHQPWPVPTGEVRSTLNGITLDTILEMLAVPQYQHLGFGTAVSGPATARWTGLGNDLEIGGQLGLAPHVAIDAKSGMSQPGAVTRPAEVPLEGAVDAKYEVDSGSVKIASMDFRLPHSSIRGKGSLGVFPISRASEVDLDFQSSDLSEFDQALRALDLTQGNRIGSAALPVQLRGQAEFHGQLNSSWLTPRVEGRLTATDIGIQTSASSGAAANAQPTFVHWDSVDVDGLYSPATIVIHHGVLKRGSSSIVVQGHLDAHDPNYKIGDREAEFDSNSLLGLKVTAQQVVLKDLLPLIGVSTPATGMLNAQIDLQGRLGSAFTAGNVNRPQSMGGLDGSATIDVDKLTLYGEALDHVHAIAAASGQQIRITNLTAQQARPQGAAKNEIGGQVTASGSYDLAHKSFTLDAHGGAIDLGSIQALRQASTTIQGKLAFTASGTGTLDDPHVQMHATFGSMNIAGEPVSDLLVSASTHQDAVSYDFSSRQPTGEFTAHGETSLKNEYETQATLRFAKFDVGALLKLLKVTGINGQSALEGSATISGPLTHLDKLRGEARLNELAVAVEGVHLASKGAVHATLVGGIVRLDPLEITGEDTDLNIHGSLAITGKQQLDLVANGSVNLRLAESVDPDLIASGVTSFQVEAHGPVTAPILQGKVEFQNAALALQDFPNGLSQIKGTLEFNQNRLEVRSLTAMSGGGQLSVGGYLGFQRGLYADLSATGKAIRIRYPQGISSLADASLKLQGPQTNLLLSGNVLVTRFAINSDLDVSSFATSTSSVQAIVAPDAPSNHIRFDVHLTSAPQLNFQNAYAKLAGDVDLHLRGTLASPSVLGRISLTEGSTSLGGTKYELQRGDINFNNPVRIQPNIDIDATARVEDYDITLGLHGSSDKPRFTYRSEPPLPEADIIALLALGRTQDEQAAYTQQQQQAGDNPMTDALLGGALNATVSNRVQRLFGSGAIKVDPNFIGSLGNSTARVTVVEQIGNNVTFTYASNVNTTTQQLIQAEIAINRHVSLLVTQDESGIFSVVVKARRRFK